MIEQIQHVKPSLMEDVLLRCDDSFCRDFDELIYEQAIFKAMKKVARKFDIIQRYIKFTNKITLNPADGTTTEDNKVLEDIELSVKSFGDEYRVMIGIRDTQTNLYKYYEYTKVTDHKIRLDKYQYHLYRGLAAWLFNYSPRGNDDEVIIYYIMDPQLDDYEDKNTTPVLPSKYDEEVQRQSLLHISKMGMAKFKEDKKRKYATIYDLEKSEKRDTKLEPNHAAIKIKPFKYP